MLKTNTWTSIPTEFLLCIGSETVSKTFTSLSDRRGYTEIASRFSARKVISWNVSHRSWPWNVWYSAHSLSRDRSSHRVQRTRGGGLYDVVAVKDGPPNCTHLHTDTTSPVMSWINPLINASSTQGAPVIRFRHLSWNSALHKYLTVQEFSNKIKSCKCDYVETTCQYELVSRFVATWCYVLKSQSSDGN